MREDTEHHSHVWDAQGQLLPLNPPPIVRHKADVAAIIVNRSRPNLVDSMVRQLRSMGQHLSMDIYVVEMGSDRNELSRHCSLYYDDPDFRGKCYGHNVGLRLARSRGDYRYYWILMNDLVFEEGVNTIGELVRVADAHPEIAVLSPTEPGSDYVNCRPKPDREFHLVTTCDYLALLVRAEAINAVGFLNPVFTYSWGAIHEYAYKLYSKGWQVAYCDRVTMKHLGGTTYGAVKDTISRREYQRRARIFAARYFVEHYGSKWDEDFSKVLPPQVEINAFGLHRRLWEARLDPKELGATYSAQGPLGTVRRLARRVSAVVTNGISASALHQQIEDLHPWYYDVRIGGIKVPPGIGSRQTAAKLRERVRYRTKLLVDEVAERYDFSGKRLLDVASNCGYWSARYARLGATSLLALEGRADYVRQGWLYWRNNQFMEPGSFEFVQGNVMEKSTWDEALKRAPFDFTLCCGILYHVPDYETLLRNIGLVTRDAVLVDTRVSQEEELIEEPGGWCFDAIVETRRKRVPSLRRLMQIMDELGFETVRLSTDEPTPKGLKGKDDYSQGRRVALLCTRAGSRFQREPKKV
jgi:hypothetical protein